MKLKRSFSVSLLFLTFILILFSCATSSSIVPGEGAAKVSNIYTEYYNLAESYFKLNDYTNAAKYYNLAMNNKKNYWASYYKLAKCYVYQNDWNNALPMYKKLLKKDPDNDSLQASVAYIYLMQGDGKKAHIEYLDLLNKQPLNKSYLENYLTLIISNEDLLSKNREEFDSYFLSYKETYPDEAYVQKLQEKLNEIDGIQPEAENTENKEEDSEEVSEETETVTE